jgi:hydrogenase expression/formation protein HypD
MEVCGGHTHAIHKFGLLSLLPENIKLLSGPGCPVCVTSKKFIDQAIAYCNLKDVILTTFGDLVRVPGSSSTLLKEKAKGADVRIVYSSLDALEIAKQNKNKKIIFLGIGFETTAPTSASVILNANQENVKNFFIYSTHKIMPPAMNAIIDEGITIDGYICPGHVSTITGSIIYESLVESYNIGCVISGFEPTDILQSILMLVNQIELDKKKVEIQYKRAVKKEGNLKAKEKMEKVFELRDDWWRGIGIIKKSGYAIKEEYKQFDAEYNFKVRVKEPQEDKGCICGEILKGIKTPADCMLFAKKCNPENPIGACMVSGEGSCNAYYRYNNYEK